MKKLFFAAAVAGSLLFGAPRASAENINIGNGTYNFTREVDREIAPGVKYTYFKCTGRGTYGTHVYVTEVDLTNPNVKVEYLTAGGTMGGSTKSLAAIASANTTTNHKVVAGANANFWITSEQPWKSQLSLMPHGTAVSNGTFYSINPRDGMDAHMGGPTTTGSIAIGTDGRAYIKRFFFHNCIYNPRIGHYLDLRDMNRVVTEGSANIYTPGYGRDKAFKPVNTTSSNTWEIAPGTCTEILCSLAPGEKLEAGGDTKYIIKEVHTNAGTGTLGSYDLAIVGRDISGAPYATVMAQNYKVGDEVILQHHFVDPNYQVTDWAKSASQPQIMPPFENATSGNCITMENGSILTSIIDAQSGYNGNVYARTLYGTNNDGTKLWIAVCGNKTSTYYGMTTTQMTYFLKYLGATYASQVDCGGSSQMYVDGSQVNKSTDSGNTRAVHSGIFVVSTGDTQVADPTLTTTATNTNFGNIAVGGSVEKTFNVTGSNLQGDITMSISGANASSFVVTPSTILKANQKGTITVKYAPTSGGSHTATLSIATPGVTTQTFTLSGTAEAVVGASAIYQDDAAAYGVTAPEQYTLELAYQDEPVAQLAGKKIKRVIARGDILYILAHDSNDYPTIVVYNHTAKQVVRTLGVENAVIPGVDNTVGVSDIAITADGSLVGMHYATQVFQSTGYGVTYKWNQDENGIAYGQPFHWNVHNNSGNYNNAYIGETIAMQGDWKTGKFVNTATTTGTSTEVRFTIQELGKVYDEGQIKSIYHNNLNKVEGYTKKALGEMLLFASPFNENNVILQGDLKAGAEFALSGAAAGVPSKVADVPSIIPAAANHTGIYRYGGKVYMTSATFSGSNNNGIMLVDITNGLASGKQVALSESSMNSAATTNVATVGTGVITMDGDKFVEARMAIIAVRNGAVTKFITPSSIETPVPDEPTLITTATNIDFGKVEVGKSASRSFTIEGYSLEGDVTISVTGEVFSATPESFAKDEASGSVTVTFAPSLTGEMTGSLTISTPAVDPVTIALKGEGIEEVVYSERNHHAYNLKKSDETDESLLVTFYSTGDAANARIIFTPVLTDEEMLMIMADNETPVPVEVSFEYGPVNKGLNSKTISKRDISPARYRWSVEIENYPVEATGKVFQDAISNANSKGGVGVITDTNSPIYGTIITSNGNAQGFRIYAPDYSIKGTYNADYFDETKGGHGKRPAWTSGNVSSPFRLAIHDNIVYTIDYADAGAGIYIFNPEHPEYGTGNIFANDDAANKDNGGCWTLNGVALGGGGSGLCFTGKGAGTKLWSFQEDYPAGNSNPQYVCRWDIGTSTNISTAPTKFDHLYGNGSNSSGPLLNTNVNLLADGDNGIFLSQNRGHADGGQTNVLYYIDLDGNIVYNSNDEGKPFNSSYAGMALNSDRSLFALCCYAADGGINLYDVTWNGNKPSFTYRETVPNTAGNQAVQMAFDAADNLVAYEQGNGLNVYSIKNENGSRILTPASTQDDVITGIENIVVNDSEATSRYFDIRGIEVPAENLTPGIYLKVTGKKVEKIRIR